ncbi:hypothetical protein QYE76_047587 [Lolium multiflorum]|uniref:Reverse transcriptase zinc-binding domain-containing protein n=1 Tax=Lolium multiflorum TaxID=4521 RepID=A0AAD8TP25_LOLMU|nr:hypothetical protein QYE76_047587 [Lolium multiflorum]
MYHLCRVGGVDVPFISFVWDNAAPSRVHFFGWLLVHATILSRASLLKKGILSANGARFLIYQAPEDTTTHLIFGCTIARQFWAKVGERHSCPILDLRESQEQNYGDN